MQKVEGSNPFIRSMILITQATWPSGLGTGLQNPLHRFDSGRRLLGLYLYEPCQFTQPRALKGPRHSGLNLSLERTQVGVAVPGGLGAAGAGGDSGFGFEHAGDGVVVGGIWAPVD
jgi:hypothetical protein